jgi:hypothetical protein
MIVEIRNTTAANMPFWEHVSKLRDPALLAILLEDGAVLVDERVDSGF